MKVLSFVFASIGMLAMSGGLPMLMVSKWYAMLIIAGAAFLAAGAILGGKYE